MQRGSKQVGGHGGSSQNAGGSTPPWTDILRPITCFPHPPGMVMIEEPIPEIIASSISGLRAHSYQVDGQRSSGPL